MIEGSHRVQTTILKAIGIVQVLIGIVAAYYGPLEIYVFYFFSKGGQFFYEGFGIGSFWFGMLVAHNISYYLLAGLLIPVGIGTLRLRRWALTLSVLYLWGLFAFGVFFIINLGILTPAFIRFGEAIVIYRLIIVSLLSLTFLILFPIVLLRFYKSNKVKNIFERNDPNIYWTEKYPLPILALLFLFLFCVIAWHLAIFFQAMFPLFGKLMFGRQMVYCIALCIVALYGLIYGVFRLKIWAWWAALIYFTLLTVSVVMTFTRYSFYQIVSMMNLPEFEMDFIGKVAVLHDYYLVGLFGLPLLLILGLLIYSRRYFTPKEACMQSGKAS